MGALEISENDKLELIQYYTTKLKGLEKEVLHCQNMLNKLKELNKKSENSTLKENIKSVISNVSGYELVQQEEKDPVPRQNWKQICLDSLKEINAFSTSNDVYSFLIKENPKYIKYDKADAVSKISTALSNLYTKGKIKRIKNPVGRGYYWSLPAWYSPELIGYYKKRLASKLGLLNETFNIKDVKK